MSIPKFTLFEHRLDEKYNTLIHGIPEMIKALKLSNSLEDGDLKKIKKDVYSDLSNSFDLEEFEIKTKDISVQNQEFSFERSIAADMMGLAVTGVAVTDYVTLYYAIYTVPYSGKIDALKYTTSYPKEEIYLTDHSGYFALTIYDVKPIVQSSEAIKREKDRILDMIEKNQKANEAFVKSKEEVLKDMIDQEIDSNFKSGRDEISDNNLLL